jgi:hypothetical protein
MIGQPGGYELGFWVGQEWRRGGFYRRGVLGEGQGTTPKSTGFGGDLPGVRRVRPGLLERDDKWV